MECEHVIDLPEEILVHIFLRFSIQGISSILAFVCSKWHDIARNPALWRQVDVQFPSLCSAIRFFHAAPLQQLRELTVNQWRGASADVVISLVAQNCPQLTKFKLGAHRVPGMTFTQESLEVLASFCQELTELDLGMENNIKGTFRSLKHDVFSRFPKLKSLTLALEVYWSGCIPDLRNNLTSLNVTILESEYCERVVSFIGDRVISFITMHHKVLTKLQVEHVYENEKFFLALHECESLYSLSINASGMEDTSLASIADLSHLTELKIKYGYFPTNAYVSFFSTHSAIHNLKKLSLYNPRNVTDEVVTAVANNCDQLISLELNNCRPVTDHGIRQIASQCHSLHNLLLPGLQKLTKRSLRAISGSLPHLRQLNIARCKIDSASVKEFTDARPAVEVIVKEEFEDNHFFNESGGISTVIGERRFENDDDLSDVSE